MWTMSRALDILPTLVETLLDKNRTAANGLNTIGIKLWFPPQNWAFLAHFSIERMQYFPIAVNNISLPDPH